MENGERINCGPFVPLTEGPRTQSAI